MYSSRTIAHSHMRRAVSATALVALLVSANGAALARVGSVVRTNSGSLEGVVADGVIAFKGVPLGQAPVGDLRWKDARPAKAWQGVRKAEVYAPACMQPKSPFFGDMTMSEDCLYLNIWTQSAQAAARRPVMVNIYGGGFTGGSTSMSGMDGTNLTKKGVVVVNLPYRVGTLGYMAHPELTKESPQRASGGYAMSDLVLGLRWVRDNVAKFGGDPSNVTVFGCSAGGHMTSYLIASPQAAGLFRRAIPESGAQFTHGPENPNMPLRAENERVGLMLAKRMGVERLADMRAVPAEKIIAVQGAGGPDSVMALPNADGYYLPLDPYSAFKTGKYNKVDILTGWASNEAIMFQQMWRGFTVASWKQYAVKVAGDRADKFLKIYPGDTDEQARFSAAAFHGDQLFGYQNYKLAQGTLRGGNAAWLYHFERPSSSPMLKKMLQGVPEALMAGLHCGNSPYSTNNIAKPNPLAGPSTASDLKLGDTLSSYYVNFARTGNPNGAGLPEWPRYDGMPTASVLRINEFVAVGAIPSPQRLQFLDKMYEARRARGIIAAH